MKRNKRITWGEFADVYTSRDSVDLWESPRWTNYYGPRLHQIALTGTVFREVLRRQTLQEYLTENGMGWAW